MFLSYTYRLYPRVSQVESLDEMFAVYREIYNAALEERRGAWRKHRKNVTFFSQAKQIKDIREIRPDVAKFNSTAASLVLRRLDIAFQAFFRRVKRGETPGYPRFHSPSRFTSVPFVFGNGANLQGKRIKVQGVGSIKVKIHRPLPTDANVRQVVIRRKGDKWYALFLIQINEPSPEPHIGKPIGVDLGLANFAALSNGEIVASPRYFRQSQKKLRVLQRSAERRKRGSVGWKQARRLVRKTHEHTANQRKDFSHKLSARLAKEFSLIAVEDLNIVGMSRSMFSKSIYDAGWSQFLDKLAYKVIKTGSRIVKIDPRHTSQVCSACGCTVQKELSMRIHDCPECGLWLDRDVNAARNILTSAYKTLGQSDDALTWDTSPSVASVFASNLGKTSQRVFPPTNINTGKVVRKYKSIELHDRFGYLVVVGVQFGRPNASGRNVTFINCRCDCGKELAVNTQSLKESRTRSCGCYGKKVFANAHGFDST